MAVIIPTFALSGHFSGLRQQLGRLRHHFSYDSLFRNSIYLTLSTVVLSGFGLVFWVLAARFYPASAIGRATTLIAAATLLSTLGLAGFDNALIRRLPASKNPNQILSAAMVAVIGLTIIGSTAYLALAPWLAPQLAFVTSTPSSVVGFEILMVIGAINTLTDAVFVARRESQYNLIVYSVFGLVRATLPLALIKLGADGIFIAYAAAVTIAAGMSLGVMIHRYEFRFRWQGIFQTARGLLTYSLLTFLATYVAGLPALILPGFVLNHLGPIMAAHYYMAAMVYALLVVVPAAVAQSVMAEGVNESRAALKHVRQGTMMSLLILVPVVGLVILFAPLLLGVFGTEYARGGATVLRILALASLCTCLALAALNLLRLQGRLLASLSLAFFSLIITLGLAFALVQFGLTGVGWAVLGGQVALASASLVVIILGRRRATSEPGMKAASSELAELVQL